MRIKTLAITLIVVASAAWSVFGATIASTRNRPNTYFVDLESQVHSRFHITFAEEDIVGDGKWGLGGLRVPPLPSDISRSEILSFLKKCIPGYKVWPDRLNRSVIHVVARKLLRLRENQLNTDITYHGKVSLDYLESHILPKFVTGVRFFNSPFDAGVKSIPYFPNLTPYKIPLPFRIKGVPLRRFLTTGIKYNQDAKRLGPWLWQATYQYRDGKLTGNVQVVICATPDVPSSSTRH